MYLHYKQKKNIINIRWRTGPPSNDQQDKLQYQKISKRLEYSVDLERLLKTGQYLTLIKKNDP